MNKNNQSNNERDISVEYVFAVFYTYVKLVVQYCKSVWKKTKAFIQSLWNTTKSVYNGNKKLTSIIAVVMIAAMFAGIIGGVCACNSCNNYTNANNEEDDFIILDFKFTDAIINDVPSAIAAVLDTGKQVGLSNSCSEFSEISVDTFGGDTYYRLQQQFDGIPVYGRNVVVAADENGKALSLSSNLSDIPGDILLTPEISSTKAINIVQGILSENSVAYPITTTIYSLFDTEPELTWQIFVQSGGKSYYFFVSALTGEIIAEQCLTYTDTMATGYGKDIDGVEQTFNTTLQDDGTYLLWDQARDIQVLNANGRTLNYCFAYAQKDKLLFYYDYGNEEWHDADGDVFEFNYTIEGVSPTIKVYDANNKLIASDVRVSLYAKTGSFLGKVWRIEACTNNSTTWSDEEAVTALTCVATSYDFYNELFGRDGFNGKHDSCVVVFNDFKNFDSANAYQWGAESDAFTLISFGKNNLMSQDTAAHEYTHAVEATISSMAYEGESGAVMEALSDIFGELVQDWQNDGLDNDCDWIHGERSLEKPSDYNYPDTYLGKHWHSTSNPSDKNDHGGVHTNNTVLSHAAYLMCRPGEDGVALSTKQLANLMYRTMFMLPSDCTFAQFRYCVEATAKIMLKNGKLYDENLERISAAFDEVGVKTKSNPTYGVKPESRINVYCADKTACSCFTAYIRELGELEYADIESTTDGFITLPPSLNSGSYIIDIFAYGENIACISVNISGNYSKNVLDIYTDYDMPLVIVDSNDDNPTVNEADTQIEFGGFSSDQMYYNNIVNGSEIALYKDNVFLFNDTLYSGTSGLNDMDHIGINNGHTISATKKYIYFIQSGKQQIAKYDYTKKPYEKIDFCNYSASNLMLHKNYVYFISDTPISETYSLYRAEADIGDPECLFDGDCGMFGCFNICNDTIYFTNADDDFSVYTMNLDGSNISKLNNQCSNYMVIEGKWLYYTSEKQGNSLTGKIYKMKLDGSENQLVLDENAYGINVYKGYIYYVNWDDSCTLHRVQIDGRGDIRLSNVEDYYSGNAILYDTLFSTATLWTGTSGAPTKIQLPLNGAEFKPTDNTSVSNESNLASNRYEWLIPPKIEATDINVIPIDTPLYNGKIWDNNYIGQHRYDNISIIKKKGRLGVIGYNGMPLSDACFIEITSGYDNLYWLSDDFNSIYTLTEKHELSRRDNDFWCDVFGTSGNGYWIWIDDRNGIVSFCGEVSVTWLDTEILTNTGPSAVYYAPPGEITVRRMDEADSDNNYYYDVDYSKVDNYPIILVNNGKRINDEYYEAAGNFCDGVIPVKKNNKWGYVDAEGNTILDFEFDAAWNWKGISSKPYNASNGYIVVWKNGQYGLYDVSGNLIVDYGTYEEIRPVYEGMFWAKQNGKWGVVALSSDAGFDVVSPEESLDNEGASVNANDGLRMRCGPSTDYEVIGVLSNNKKVTICGMNNDWSYILVDSVYGWVKSSYLD